MGITEQWDEEDNNTKENERLKAENHLLRLEKENQLLKKFESEYNRIHALWSKDDSKDRLQAIFKSINEMNKTIGRGEFTEEWRHGAIWVIQCIQGSLDKLEDEKAGIDR
ncbi:MAG: hypothetical protein V3U78_05385 [Thiotrichaceae bacterium]